MIEFYTQLLIDLLKATGTEYKHYTIVILLIWYMIPAMIVSTFITLLFKKLTKES